MRGASVSAHLSVWVQTLVTRNKQSSDPINTIRTQTRQSKLIVTTMSQPTIIWWEDILPETSKIELSHSSRERWNPQFPPERRGVRPSLLDILEDSFHLQRTSARQSSTPKGALTIKPAVPKSSHPTHLYSRGPGFCLEVQRAWWTVRRRLLGTWEGRVIVGTSNNVENLQKVTIFMIELARQ